MYTPNMLDHWDMAILMVPIFGFLILWLFRLDERVTAPRERSTRRRFCQADGNASYLYDPDGRPVLCRNPTPPPAPLTGQIVEIQSPQKLLSVPELHPLFPLNEHKSMSLSPLIVTIHTPSTNRCKSLKNC
jgi:hypothetical protein